MSYKTYRQFKKEWGKDSSFRKGYEDLASEFNLIQSIIEMRLKKGMTQKELAEKIGTGQSAIARLESGRYNPTVAFLNKLSGALGTRLEIKLKRV
ncbi:MAG: transcriptional regulator [Parcubacteria group bacterium CG11_big_fil_rev_8_21_14_0_20_39_22]|nr:MAG: transcriptional regulator [Parcubacteria group bacterium CG11_big_fil_rev_8_21_14_0_20_39_22]